MSEESTVVCAVCGSQTPTRTGRCVACGAKFDVLSDSERRISLAPPVKQEGFSAKWFFVSLAIFAVVLGIVLVVLPAIIPAYSPAGLPGLILASGIWLVGGMVIGGLSKTRTVFEPAAAAVLSAIPTVFWIERITIAQKLSVSSYVAAVLIAILAAMLGAILAEKLLHRAEK